MSHNNIRWPVTVAVWLVGAIPLWFVWDTASAVESLSWIRLAIYVAAFLYLAEIPWLHSKLSAFFR